MNNNFYSQNSSTQGESYNHLEKVYDNGHWFAAYLSSLFTTSLAVPWSSPTCCCSSIHVLSRPFTSFTLPSWDFVRGEITSSPIHFYCTFILSPMNCVGNGKRSKMSLKLMNAYVFFARVPWVIGPQRVPHSRHIRMWPLPTHVVWPISALGHSFKRASAGKQGLKDPSSPEGGDKASFPAGSVVIFTSGSRHTSAQLRIQRIRVQT